MRKSWAGAVCMAAGVLLLLAAGGFWLRDRREDAQAGEAAQLAVQDLKQRVEEDTVRTEPAEVTPPPDPELPVVELDGEAYVGELSIPALELDLPVMQTWSYPNLKKAPCRVRGSSRTEDLVIAAHNYRSHFGQLGTLAAGDAVCFTDGAGIPNHYTVQKVEVHLPTEVEEVEHSGFPLVLYTCTYGGKTRVVVFCARA